MIRILLVDDQTLVRAGLRRLLEAVPDFEVAGECGDAGRAIACARRVTPDVVLLNAGLDGLGGPELVRRLRRQCADTAIVAFGEQSAGPYPMHLFEAGAAGYLTPTGELAELEAAVRAVASGQRYLSGDVARNLALARGAGAETPLDELSRREMEVLMHLSRAHRLTHIAEVLCISPKTVSTYRTRVCRKLGVSTDVELAHVALRYGLLNPASI